MAEKIKASDLIDKDVLVELSKVEKAITSVIKVTADLMSVMQKQNEVLKQGAANQKTLSDNVKKNEDNSRKLNDVEKEIQKIQEKHYQTLTKMVAARGEENKKLQEATEKIKREVKERKSEVDSLEGLRAKQQLLRESREKLKFSDKDYAANLKKVNAEINANDKAIKKATDSEEKRTRGIGLYKESIVKAYVAIQGAIIFARAAFNLFIETLKSTGDGADKFEFTLEGIKQGFNRIKVAVSTLDFKDFIKNVKDAIAEGRRYAEGLDDIDDKTRALKISEAKAANAILEQRKIQNSALSTTKEKIAAGKEILKIEEDLQVIRTGIADQAYKNELDNITKIANAGKEINDSMRNEIELYVSRDAAIIKSVENGVKYEKNLKEINDLQRENDKNVKSGISDPFALLRINELRAENNKLYDDYLIKVRLTTPTDEKYNQLVSKRVELEQAKGSALENTLRIQSKLDTAINKDEESNESKKEKLQKEGDERLKQRLDAENKSRDVANKYFEEQDKKEEARGIERAKTMADIDREYYDARIKADEETQKRLDASYIKDRANYIREQEEKKKANEELAKLQEQSVSAAADLGFALSDRKIAKLEEEKEAEIKAAGNSAKEKERIEAEYNKKIGAIKKKQAMADKALSIFSVVLDTAKGIMNALSRVATAPLVPWITLMGAAQTASILATPIPKFFKGAKNLAKDTLGIVGDKAPGKSGDSFELIETPNKGMFLTPNIATEMLIPKGSTIHPHEESVKMMNGMSPRNLDKLLKEQQLTRSAIANQVHNEWRIDENGLEYTRRRGNSTERHINIYFRR